MKDAPQVLQEILDRVVRIETRIVQLMYYQGANPNSKYDDDKEEAPTHAKPLSGTN